MSFQHLNWWGSGWWRYQLNTNWWCQYYWQLENMGMQVAPSGSSDNVYHVNICISPSYLYIYLKQIPSLLLQWSVRPQCNMTQWKQVDISYKLHNKVKCVKNKLSDLRRCSMGFFANINFHCGLNLVLGPVVQVRSSVGWII